MSDTILLDRLVAKMEWLLLAMNAHSTVPVATIMSTDAAYKLCISITALIVSVLLIEHRIRKSVSETGKPRLGLVGFGALMIFPLSLMPILSASTWLAAFGNPYQELGFAALNTGNAGPISPDAMLNENFRAMLRVSATRMVKGLAVQEFLRSSINLLISFFVLHSTLVRGNRYISKGSPVWLFLGGSLFFFAISSLVRPELWDAIHNNPEPFLRHYEGAL